FAGATGGRGSVNLSPGSRAGSVRIAHTPLHDTEDVGSPRPIGARVTIDQAGIPLAVDPASVRAYARTGRARPGRPLPLPSVAPVSFAASPPAAPSGTTVQYSLAAASDSTGITATDPPEGAAAPHSYFAGPDVAPPMIQHVPIPEQSPLQ